MAVLITKSGTLATPNDLTTNEFYRVESYQLGVYTTTGGQALSTARQIPVTFANAGNCMGVVVLLRSAFTDVTTDFRGVTCELQENVASVWTTRTSTTLTRAQILAGTNPAGRWLVPFEFGTPYAVNTTAGIWRFNIYSSAGVQTRHFDLYLAAATTYIYATWCDTQLTPVSGADFIIFKNYCNITSSFTFKGYLGTGGDTTRPYCAWVCRNLDATPDNVCYVRVPTSIGSAVTIGIDGYFVLSCHAGFQAGTEAVPHTADMVKITLNNFTVGTVGSSGFGDITALSASGGETNRLSLRLYGVYPSKKYATATTTCAISGTSITVDDASMFAVNDFVLIGKRSGNNTDESGTPRHMITNIAGNVLTFTPGLSTLGSLIGARVVKTYNNVTNATGYGITIRRVGGSSLSYMLSAHGVSSNWTMIGVFLELCSYNGVNTGGSVEDAAYVTPYLFKDCFFLSNSALSSYTAVYSHVINGGGMPYTSLTFRNCIFTRCGMMNGGMVWGVVSSGNPGVNYVPTKMYFYNLMFFRCPTNAVINGGIDSPLPAAIVNIADGIFVDSVGGGRAGLYCNGTSSSWKNIEVWASGASITYNGGAVRVAYLFNSVIENVKVNLSTLAMNFEGVVAGVTIKNVTFGDEIANTYDIRANAKTYVDAVFKTITGNPIMDTVNIAEFADGTEMSFENVNASNVDYQIQPYGNIYRTGVGLADTTVRTAGGYGLRFQSKSGTVPTYWTQSIPTGNIQNKTAMVGIWVNIANAAYWAGTHQMPRITVSYDNGASTAYAEAAQATGWQFIFVPFTPTTTFGQITVTFTTKTDATTTNAYVYFDDISMLYPAGHQLNLGALDLWADGLPVVPSIATNLSAQDVWAADPTGFGASTVGDKVNKIKTDAGLIPALL